MRQYYSRKMSAFADAFLKTKTIKQKNLVFAKFSTKEDHVTINGITYDWSERMLDLKKFNFPACAPIPGIVPNMDLIKAFMDQHNDKWGSPYDQMPGLCLSEGDLASATYNQVEHLCLTGPNPDLFDEIEGDSKEFCEANHDKITAKDKLKGNMLTLMDEYNWSNPLDIYKNTELEEHLNSLFKGNIIRVKYSRLLPGKEIPPHIDYNTTYAIRFIIPIEGTEGVINRFWYKGEVIDYNLEPGKVYFLNIGYKHQVINNGDSPRYNILGTLDSQEDILSLKL